MTLKPFYKLNGEIRKVKTVKATIAGKPVTEYHYIDEKGHKAVITRFEKEAK